MNATKNKTKPFIHIREYQDPGRQEPVVTLRTMLYAAKRKDGMYRLKDYMWSYAKNSTAAVNEDIVVRDISKKMRQGRYHDWFFIRSPLVK